MTLFEKRIWLELLNSNRVWVAKDNSSNKIDFRYRCQATTVLITSSGNTTTDWIHLALNFNDNDNGGLVEAFQNGVSIDTGNQTNTWSTTNDINDIYIGSSDGGTFTHGYIALATYWADTNLTQKEINMLAGLL